MKTVFSSLVELDQSSEPLSTEITVVKSGTPAMMHQRSPRFVGISANTAGAKGLSMNLMIIPPGEIGEPRLHPGHETAIYLLRGRIEVRYGEGLNQRRICEVGDFIFTPPGVPHQLRNLSDTEPVYVLAARNDPDEREESVPYTMTS